MSKNVSENSAKSNEQTNIPESVMTLKNFRTASDIDHFYRFVNDNNLRREAKIMLEMVSKALTPPKRRRRRKKTIH